MHFLQHKTQRVVATSKVEFTFPKWVEFPSSLRTSDDGHCEFKEPLAICAEAKIIAKKQFDPALTLDRNVTIWKSLRRSSAQIACLPLSGIHHTTPHQQKTGEYETNQERQSCDFQRGKGKKKKAFKGKMSPLLNVARVRGKGDQ